MPKIMMIIILQVRDQVLYVHVVGLEGSAVGKVEIAYDFVDEEVTGDAAAFGVLFGDFV